MPLDTSGRAIHAGRRLAPLALALAASCTSIVRPPASPPEPTRAYVVYGARHRGVVLPAEAGGYVEFGYGDFDWYALGKDRWYHACDTVLWPTGGTLATRRIDARDELGLLASFEASRLVTIVVSAERARALASRLEREFERGGRPFFRPEIEMHFVRSPRRFWCLYNCNDATAEWLEELGCSVSRVPIRKDLEVVPPAGSDALLAEP